MTRAVLIDRVGHGDLRFMGRRFMGRRFEGRGNRDEQGHARRRCRRRRCRRGRRRRGDRSLGGRGRVVTAGDVERASSQEMAADRSTSGHRPPSPPERPTRHRPERLALLLGRSRRRRRSTRRSPVPPAQRRASRVHDAPSRWLAAAARGRPPARGTHRPRGAGRQERGCCRSRRPVTGSVCASHRAGIDVMTTERTCPPGRDHLCQPSWRCARSPSRSSASAALSGPSRAGVMINRMTFGSQNAGSASCSLTHLCASTLSGDGHRSVTSAFPITSATNGRRVRRRPSGRRRGRTTSSRPPSHSVPGGAFVKPLPT